MTRVALIVTAALALIGLIYWRGGHDQRATDAVRDAVNYTQTRGAIDDAVSDDLSDDLILERLRRHAER